MYRNRNFQKSTNPKWFFGALASKARDQPIDDATASRIHFKIKYNNLGLAELEH
jgi:hypothetical protein